MPTDRVHGYVSKGGQASNIIPEYCTAVYAVRSPDPVRIKELMRKVENCFRGAAMSTGTECEVKWTRTLETGGENLIAGLNVHSNELMAGRFQKYLSKDGTKFSTDGGLLAMASTVWTPTETVLTVGLRRSQLYCTRNTSDL
jgi:metal-dependent amidase/aminoacylase/carboxypeptidase family protein